MSLVPGELIGQDLAQSLGRCFWCHQNNIQTTTKHGFMEDPSLAEVHPPRTHVWHCTSGTRSGGSRRGVWSLSV